MAFAAPISCRPAIRSGERQSTSHGELAPRKFSNRIRGIVCSRRKPRDGAIVAIRHKRFPLPEQGQVDVQGKIIIALSISWQSGPSNLPEHPATGGPTPHRQAVRMPLGIDQLRRNVELEAIAIFILNSEFQIKPDCMTVERLGEVYRERMNQRSRG